MNYARESRYCSSLNLKPAQILAEAALPKARRHACATHYKGTVDRYLPCIARFIRWSIRVLHVQFSEKPEHVLRFMKHLEREGCPIPTLLMHRTALNSYLVSTDRPRLSSLRLSRYLAELAARHKRRKATPFQNADVQAMCRVAAQRGRPLLRTRNVALLLVPFSCGMRTGETRNLQFHHVRFDPREGMEIYIPGTEFHDDARSVKIPYAKKSDFCPVRALQALIKELHITEGYIFRPSQGMRFLNKPLGEQQLRNLYRSLAKEAGVEGAWITGYSTRRGFASVAIQEGADFEDVRPVMGHEDIATTREYDARLPAPYDRTPTRLVVP